MISAALQYAARHPSRALDALRDPLSIWDTLYDRMIQKRERRRPDYTPEADPDWEERLAVGLNQPGGAVSEEFEQIWAQMIAEMEAMEIPTGPLSFYGFNDGDRGFARAIWRLVRATRPLHVVETGVAHGVTSRFILEAMGRNGAGHLWSIDRRPLDPAMRAQVGAAVGTPRPRHWTLIEGTSRRRLPGLLRSLGSIDLFIHDSLHTERNVLFELSRAWKVLKPGGAMVVDDVDSNWGFDSFAKRHVGFRAMICEAEPIRPDERRFNRKGLFAIVLKDW